MQSLHIVWTTLWSGWQMMTRRPHLQSSNRPTQFVLSSSAQCLLLTMPLLSVDHRLRSFASSLFKALSQHLRRFAWRKSTCMLEVSKAAILCISPALSKFFFPEFSCYSSFLCLLFSLYSSFLFVYSLHNIDNFLYDLWFFFTNLIVKFTLYPNVGLS